MTHYDKLFSYMHEQLGITPTEGQMYDLIEIVRKMDTPDLLPFQWPVPDGMEVVTRDGIKVEQLRRFEAENEDFPILGVLGGVIEGWTIDGLYAPDASNNSGSFDLFLRPIERKVWVVEWPKNKFSAQDSPPIGGDAHGAVMIYEATLKPVK